MAEVTVPLGGVYVVCLDRDIAGDDNLVWAFRDEWDADAVVAALCRANGPGTAWHSYEPIATSLADPDLLGYLADRGVAGRALKAAACG